MCPALWGNVGRGDYITFSGEPEIMQTVKGQDERYGKCGFKNDQRGGQEKYLEKR